MSLPGFDHEAMVWVGRDLRDGFPDVYAMQPLPGGRVAVYECHVAPEFWAEPDGPDHLLTVVLTKLGRVVRADDGAA
jgi:hypothetical protein